MNAMTNKLNETGGRWADYRNLPISIINVQQRGMINGKTFTRTGRLEFIENRPDAPARFTFTVFDQPGALNFEVFYDSITEARTAILDQGWVVASTSTPTSGGPR